MKSQSSKTTGLSLLIGSFLMFATMLLHPGPEGGLTQGMTFAIISHAIAIASLPVSAIGFFGLSKLLDEEELLSRVAFSTMVLGLLSGAIAAALNGLAMPMFSQDFTPEMFEKAEVIFDYNKSLNHSFDYILIAAMFLSTLLWSAAILRTKVLPKWLGYLGIGLFIIGLITVFSGFNFLNVGGFRLFVYGWVVWIVGTGISILRRKTD